MWKLAVRGVRENAGRYVATLVAIITGVAFFAASGFLGDRVIAALEGNARTQYEHVDAAITVDDDPDSPGGEFASELRLSGDVVDQVLALPQVVAVGGDLKGAVAFAVDDGATVSDDATGRLWIEDDDLNPIDIVEGRAPLASGEIAVDRDTADDARLTVDGAATLLTLAGPQQVTVVGVTEFGDTDAQDSGGTVSIAAADAFEWLNSGQVEYENLLVRGNGLQADLVAEIQPVVPDGFVVETGEDFIRSKVDEASSFGKVLRTGLQIFAVLALFVGGFVIINTFTVIVAQRLRELAVLAAIGATPKQIKRSLRLEGLVIGVVGSALGVLVGLALTFVLIAVLSAVGVGLPGDGVVVSADVVVQGLLAGTLITLVSVMRPAQKAAKTEPIEALRDAAVESASLTRGRIITALVLVGIGTVGLLAGPSAALIGVSAVSFFVGMIVAGPIIALAGSRIFRPVGRALGLEGRLAADNIGRNPQRTATTSNALLIGVFLVTLVIVAGSSLKDFAVSQIDELSASDFVMQSTGGTVDDQLIVDIEAIDDVERVVPFRTETLAERGGSATGFPVVVSTGDFTALTEVANIQLSDGSLDNLGDDDVAVVDLGDTTPEMGTTVTYIDSAGTSTQFTVVAVIEPTLDSLNLGNLVSTATFDRFIGETAPTKAFIDAKNSTQSDVEDEIEQVTDQRPDITLTAGNALSRLVAQIFDFVIYAINGLLLMSVVVALIGIVNTMSLSIIERRRELGLLRVVGMVDKRVRRMVRIESMLISVLGTVTGVLMGAFTGFALVFAIDRLSDANISTQFAYTQLLVIVVVGVVLGYIAALIPASRSTRPELLDAIQVS